jgi:hypothetical protein
VEECHLPGLGVALTLDHTKNEACEDGVSDLVCFVSGLLLGTNAKVRTWFGTFIRNGQQVRVKYICRKGSVFLLFSETVSPFSQPGLELKRYARLALNSLPSAVIAGVHHHGWQTTILMLFS